MQLAVLVVLGCEVVAHRFGHQVAAVRGGVDQHVVARRCHRPVERRLQGLVPRLARLEREVVAEQDEALRPSGHQGGNAVHVPQVVLVDLDQPQAIGGMALQAGAHQGTLARAACPGEQHVVGRQATHELLGVAQQGGLLRVHVLQVCGRDARHAGHGLEHAALHAQEALPAPAKGAGAPVGRDGCSRQQRLQAREQIGQTALELGRHGTSCGSRR